MATVGTGTSVSFATGFFAEIIDISWSGVSREVIETTHMGTTTARTYTPGDLYDPGEAQVQIAFAPGTAPPWGDAAETVTVTWPDAGAATWAASGFMSDFEGGAAIEERMTATATLKFSGSITVTP